MDKTSFKKAIASLGLNVSEQQLRQFEDFEDNLYTANSIMNLTRIPREECWLRHFVDSLLFQDLIPVGASVADIGTGPGFPAWPLACARPDLKVTALDSSRKMTGFLQKNPLPNLSVVLDRAEDWRVRERFDIVTGRAVAPFGIQMELSAPPCKVGGLIIPMRTPADEEPSKLFKAQPFGLELERIEKRELPGTDVIRAFPIYRKIAKTVPRFPRTWAEIKKSPLS